MKKYKPNIENIIEFIIDLAIGFISTLLLDIQYGIILTIVLFVMTVSRFLFQIQLRDYKKSINDLSEKIGSLNPLYKKLIELEDERLLPYISVTLENSNKAISRYIDEKRTGALESTTYYEELFKLANELIEDKKRYNHKYNGEIWAMSSFLDEEWQSDFNYETRWVEILHKMENEGIKTRRLFIFPPHILKFLNTYNTNNYISDINKFINCIEPYCSNPPKLTTSFATKQNSNLTELEKCQGFFGVKFHNGDLKLILDVSLDAKTSTGTLAGEIIFDEERIKRIRNIWDQFTTDGATSLKDYIRNNSSDEVKKLLRNRNII